jgi:hypothetical protein
MIRYYLAKLLHCEVQDVDSDMIAGFDVSFESFDIINCSKLLLLLSFI